MYVIYKSAICKCLSPLEFSDRNFVGIFTFSYIKLRIIRFLECPWFDTTSQRSMWLVFVPHSLPLTSFIWKFTLENYTSTCTSSLMLVEVSWKQRPLCMETRMHCNVAPRSSAEVSHVSSNDEEEDWSTHTSHIQCIFVCEKAAPKYRIFHNMNYVMQALPPHIHLHILQ
jgi:hypothetical protein